MKTCWYDCGASGADLIDLLSYYSAGFRFGPAFYAELWSNNLHDLGQKKGLIIAAPCAKGKKSYQSLLRFQAQPLNVHFDFPLLQRIALSLSTGAVRAPEPQQTYKNLRPLTTGQRCFRWPCRPRGRGFQFAIWSCLRIRTHIAMVVETT